MATTIAVTFISSLPSTTSMVSIPIASSLVGLDSSQSAASQTGFSAVDVTIANITRRGGVLFTDESGVLTFIPMSQILKIAAQ